jgi:hypothetical protein
VHSRNKKCVTLDLRRPAGQRLFRRLGADSDPYDSAAELCAELRERRAMTLACDKPRPLLGVGFDLQSEFSTWLQCRTLFSAVARPRRSASSSER